MLLLGAGYNPCFTAKLPENRLALPKDVSLIELGLQELDAWTHSSASLAVPLSLHIARCPITEAANVQKLFLQELKARTSSRSFTSIGFHLTGPRSSGIGRVGFSSHYNHSAKDEERAIGFIKTAQDLFGIPIWVENANFYSSGAHEIFDNWRSLSRIVDATQAKVILDLSHLIIDFVNVENSPFAAWGLIPWSHIVEFHLSGIVTSQDGALHDGHSVPVDPRVWNLLGSALALIPKTSPPIYLTIEHTDPAFIYRQEAFYKDFVRAASSLEVQYVQASHELEAEKYALSNLYRIVMKRLPLLEDSLRKKNRELRPLIRAWIESVSQQNQRILLSETDRFHFEAGAGQSIERDFVPFIRRQLAC